MSNKGLEAWEAKRKEWTTPNQHYYDNKDIREANNAKYEAIVKDHLQRITIYKHLVHNRLGLKTPIPLKYIIPIVVSGWQEDGLWPKGEVVKTNSD